jgi:dTDP-4-dehydrorhamnose reductase
MKILITGVNGLVGNSLYRLLQDSDHKLFFSSRNLEGLANYKVDITDKVEVNSFFKSERPDVVINSAAMANVDMCEEEQDPCWKVNVEGVQNLVEACDQYSTHLTHISTDYIFDGKKKSGIYNEDDLPNPQSYYSKSKLAGEEVISRSQISYSILRTILVYGIHKNANIVTFVKNSLEANKTVNLVSDQVRMPTFVDDLSKACIKASEKKAAGVFHICGPEQMSYLDIGNRIADHFSLDKNLINHVNTIDLNQKAVRPFKTGFDLRKAINILNYKPTKFEDSLDFIF